MATKPKYTHEELARKYLDACLKAGRWLSCNSAAGAGISPSTLARYFPGMIALRALAQQLHGKPIQFLDPAGLQVKRYLTDEVTMPHDYGAAKKKLDGIIKYVQKERPRQSKVKTHLNYGVLACLHIPNHSEKNLVRAVEWFKGRGVTTLILAGDVIDCLSVGHAGYRRNIREQHYVSLKQELSECKSVLAYLSKQFDRIVIMKGNHPERVRKWFTERVGPELMFLVQHNVMSLVAGDFPNVTVVDTESGGNELHWIYQVGDVTITHAEVGSTIELRPTVRVDQWFKEWNDYLRMAPYTMLIEAHTHQAGILPLNDGAKILVEAGCVCREPQYAVEPTMKYRHPQVNAVTYFRMDDGKVNINSVKQYVFRGME